MSWKSVRVVKQPDTLIKLADAAIHGAYRVAEVETYKEMQGLTDKQLPKGIKTRARDAAISWYREALDSAVKVYRGDRGNDRKPRKPRISHQKLSHRKSVKIAIQEMFEAGQEQNTTIKKRVAKWLGKTYETLKAWEDKEGFTVELLTKEVQRERSQKNKRIF